ncbi:MAG: hypothetical protein M3144_07135, partial [Actinomycetota bacterium]|nr:hypothetical protein [Actinomycetota bacterium]
ALDSALREGLASIPYIERRLATQGRKGAAALRALLADRAEKGPYESRREAQLARQLVAAGLPEPVRQHELREGGRVIARFDLAWPEARIAVEFQSYRHHFGRRAWRRDAGRTNEAAAWGWRVFMATDEDLGDNCVSLAAHVAGARAA